MIHWKTISDDQARAAIAAGEFPEAVIRSADLAAVILTQGWCPQWAALKHDLERVADSCARDIDIHVFIYDRSPLFDEFLAFKENNLGNDRIPYVRYYRQGVFSGDSNYLSEESFLKKFA
jgi:hypothetical protein